MELFKYNDDLKMLDEYFPGYKYEWDEEDNVIININGKTYKSEFSLSPEVSDAQCRRVNINGEYYYFS